MTVGKPQIKLSEHARSQSVRRGLTEAAVLEVARAPEQRLAVRPGREIRQSRISVLPGATLYLLRVVVDAGPDEETVVTVYRTSKIEKYWSNA